MTDTGITDTCIFHVPGAAPNWWLSPDINLVSASGQQDKADPAPAENTIGLTVHRKAFPCALEQGKRQVFVDLFVCDPAMAIIPANAVQMTLTTTSTPPFTNFTGFDIASLPAGGSAVFNDFWQVPSGVTSGHHCLIIRSYPNGETPDPGNFHVNDDQHYAQHNICIIPCNDCSFDVNTDNLDDAPRNVKLRIVNDRAPQQQVLQAVIPRLQQLDVSLRRLESLKRITGAEFVRRMAPTRPRGFRLELPDFRRAEVVDHSDRDDDEGAYFGHRRHPFWDANIVMQPRQHSRVRFRADLRGSSRGDVHLFHLMHIAGRRVRGGITLVAVEGLRAS
jgi:hypothetical protein